MDTTLKIGKEGLDNIVNQADSQLTKNNEIKVKVNSPLVEGRMSEFTKKMAEKLASKTQSKVLWVKGRTFVLRRE